MQIADKYDSRPAKISEAGDTIEVKSALGSRLFSVPLELNIAKFCSQPANAMHADCYNDPFVPDEASSLEKGFHDFLNDQDMKELNVTSFL